MKNSTKIFLVLLPLLMLVIVSSTIGNSKSLVYGYTLEVRPFGGSSDQAISIYVINQDTNYFQHKDYVGLPPSSVFFEWVDSQFPEGSNFRVCAIDTVTNQIFNCVDASRGFGADSEFVDLNLNP